MASTELPLSPSIPETQSVARFQPYDEPRGEHSHQEASLGLRLEAGSPQHGVKTERGPQYVEDVGDNHIHHYGDGPHTPRDIDGANGVADPAAMLELEGSQGSQDAASLAFLEAAKQQQMIQSPVSMPPTSLYSHYYMPQDGRVSQYYAGSGGGYHGDGLTSQKAVAFLSGPRERIHVFGNPVELCPRCLQEGYGSVSWRPHRHIGELKIRYICERNFDDLESNHHFDIPLCPLCGQVLYLYEFNGMLGVSSARRLHKYVLKCANRHVLPLIDLFCQTKRGGERCNANFKLQWSYGTMVKRCEAQKNRDHDLWWVRYKNEWKQRRTIIRYKKDFLRHLSDVQRALLLGLGIEGEAPPEPKGALGPTYDALLASASVGGSPSAPKIKKMSTRYGMSQLSSQSSPDDFDYDVASSGSARQQQEYESAMSHMGNIGFPYEHPYHQMMQMGHLQQQQLTMDPSAMAMMSAAAYSKSFQAEQQEMEGTASHALLEAMVGAAVGGQSAAGEEQPQLLQNSASVAQQQPSPVSAEWQDSSVAFGGASALSTFSDSAHQQFLQLQQDQVLGEQQQPLNNTPLVKEENS